MTIIDIIDEAFTEMGCSKESLSDARLAAISRYCTTKDTNERVNKDLSPEEITLYRAQCRLFLMSVLSDPEKIKQLMEQHKKEVEQN
jgi:hypothetical protein